MAWQQHTNFPESTPDDGDLLPYLVFGPQNMPCFGGFVGQDGDTARRPGYIHTYIVTLTVGHKQAAVQAAWGLPLQTPDYHVLCKHSNVDFDHRDVGPRIPPTSWMTRNPSIHSHDDLSSRWPLSQSSKRPTDHRRDTFATQCKQDKKLSAKLVPRDRARPPTTMPAPPISTRGPRARRPHPVDWTAYEGNPTPHRLDQSPPHGSTGLAGLSCFALPFFVPETISRLISRAIQRLAAFPPFSIF